MSLLHLSPIYTSGRSPARRIRRNAHRRTATHCNTPQHTATHCDTLQHPVTTHCNTLQHTATRCTALQRTATHCNTLHRTATHYNARNTRSQKRRMQHRTNTFIDSTHCTTRTTYNVHPNAQLPLHLTLAAHIQYCC